MRGHQVGTGTDPVLCPATEPLSPDPSADAPRPVPSHRFGNSQSRLKTSVASSRERNFVVRCSPNPRSSCGSYKAHSVNKVKPVIAPPVFLFQKTALPVKRLAEDSVDKICLGASPGKRGRSFTFPSPSASYRAGETGPADRQQRERSSSVCSFSFPPSRPVSRKNVFMPSSLCNPNIDSSSPVDTDCSAWKAKGPVLRPATLQAPRPHSISPPLPAEGSCSLTTADTPCSGRAPDQQAPTELHSFPGSRPPGIESDTTFPSSTFPQLVPPQADRSPVKMDLVATESSFPFVFGENMSERVLSPMKTPDADVSDNSEDGATAPESSSSESDSDSESPTCGSPHGTVRRRTLRESAAACTAASGRRCLLKRVRVFTGEELESNVVQMTCKLFVFEKATQSWRERGRGILRLNDLAAERPGSFQSRLVMRNQGSLKVILNSKLWADMHVHRASRRNLQLTATELEERSVRIFLVQGGAKDIARLNMAIHHRLVALRCAGMELGRAPSLEGPESGPALRPFDSEEEEEEEQILTHLGCSTAGGSDWSYSQPRIRS
ncbi:ran-binding protein 3 isoform X2 [Lepisosteus oculatus]|uniref:RAN binding protein 3 like n=1 Tax=Lepisosteus oculatus TaxID=7918 RepID=W5N4V8_LEPOC|nr:PREDICTED: ran-binding protein 3-like isoform X2 [Lepisosteus oculatus]